MLHAALKWPDQHDKTLWPLAMSYAVTLHNNTPRSVDGICPVEIWTQSKTNYSLLINSHPWGCPVYVLNPSLQDGFKTPKWEPRSRRGVFMGFSPLHASTVGLIRNPHTNRISPQYHCVYDDYFETIHNGDSLKPPEIWEDLVINQTFRNELEEDEDIPDTWNLPNQMSNDSPEGEASPRPSADQPTVTRPCEPAVDDEPQVPSQTQKQTPSETAQEIEETSGGTQDQTPEENYDPVTEESPPLRHSTRQKKGVDRFKFDKAHGYSVVKRYMKNLIQCLCLWHSVRQVHDMNYIAALALDPEYGVLDNFNNLSPDILTRNPWMFKSTKKDPDTPGIREALTGEYKEDFLQGMVQEIEELEKHKTWELMKRSDIQEHQDEDGTWKQPTIVPLT